MIRLSTKGRYGTRLMLNLASHYGDGGGKTILKSIAEEEDISFRYLEQLIIPLKINKLVKSIRGANGGYALGRDPAKISVLEILNTLEGTSCLVECVEDPAFCERLPFCATHEVWKEATLLLKNYFESITLADLLKISKKKLKEVQSD